MKKIFFPLFLITICFSVTAQRKPKSIAGEYFLRGVMEVASGFKLYKDSSFQFYFSYGALDRFGSGKWTIDHDNALLLTTREKPAYDFALIKTDTILSEPDSITIKITDPNKVLLPHIYCTLHDTETAYEQATNNDGIIKFSRQALDSINLIFEFAPERNSKICIELLNRQNNYFEFKLEPWIAEVFFDKLPLFIEDEKLKGAHPLLSGESYLYFKN